MSLHFIGAKKIFEEIHLFSAIYRYVNPYYWVDFHYREPMGVQTLAHLAIHLCAAIQL